MLTGQQAELLLTDLCRRLGFCLSPKDYRRLSDSPPSTVPEFTGAVFSAEGLDPATADRHLYRQVKEIVANAFRSAELTEAPDMSETLSALSTAELLVLALECVRRERAGDDVEPNPALLALQQRADGEVLEAALACLGNEDPAYRQLGAQLLRGLPGLHAAPYPHSLRAVVALEALAVNELDEEVLGWALAAIGWQKMPEGERVLLRLADDPRRSVRRVVANNLLMAVGPGRGLSAGAAAALCRLAVDEDADIRGSVRYDMDSFPELFEPYRAAFDEALEKREARE